MAIRLLDPNPSPARIDIPRQPEMDLTLDLTWSCFFTLDRAAFDLHYIMTTASFMNGGIAMGFFSNGVYIFPRLESLTTSGKRTLAFFADTVLINTGWHHMAAVKEAGPSGSSVAVRLYLDGELSAQTPGLRVDQSSRDLSLGTVFRRMWPGDVADARWYTKALTQEEILAIASQQGKDDLTDGLLLRYPLAEQAPGQLLSTAAGAIKDVGPNGFHGKAYNIVESRYAESPLASRKQFSVDAPQLAV